MMLPKGASQFGQEEAYLATAKYCDNVLHMKENGYLHSNNF